MKNTPYAVLVSALLFASAGSAQNLLTNGDFESGTSGWITFGNAFAGEPANPPEVVPLSGSAVGKLFGTFSGGFNVSGMFQEFPAAPGDQFTLDCWSRHFSGDAMVGGGAAGVPQGNWCVMKMAFFDAGNAEIGGFEGTILDGNSPTDTWIDNPAVNGTAPAGTTKVQALILYLQPAFDGGAAQVDDVEFTTSAPPMPSGPTINLLANPGFEDGLDGWGAFGNVFAEAANPAGGVVPQNGTQLCKLFGNFSGGFNVSGFFQTFGAEAGQTFTMDAASRHFGGDPMIGGGAGGMPQGNWVVMKIAFFDAGGTEIGAAEGTILDGTSPTDTWIDNPAIAGTAPAGTTSVQALILYLQPAFDGGAALIDDVVFSATANCDLAVNGGFETGDTTGWQEFPSAPGQISIVPGNGSTSAVNINNSQPASAALIKNANVGQALGWPNPEGVQPNETIVITFDAKGATDVGGVAFAELFSELSGGGISFGEILGGAPLALDPDPNTWTTFSFTTTTGPDVSGGVTLQLAAITGGAPGSFADITFDNVSIEVVRTSATWTNYGAGWPGTNGEPTISMDSNPYLGDTANIVLTSASNATELAVLLVGDTQLALPSGLGGTVLNNIVFPLNISLPPAGTSLALPVPALSYLCGSELYIQMLHLDTGASDNLAFTNGLRLIFGEEQ